MRRRLGILALALLALLAVSTGCASSSGGSESKSTASGWSPTPATTATTTSSKTPASVSVKSGSVLPTLTSLGAACYKAATGTGAPACEALATNFRLEGAEQQTAATRAVAKRGLNICAQLARHLQ